MYVDVTNSDRKKINSISNFKSGSVIQINDVSPVTHEMGVKVRSKNLYYNSTHTFNATAMSVGTYYVFIRDSSAEMRELLCSLAGQTVSFSYMCEPFDLWNGKCEVIIWYDDTYIAFNDKNSNTIPANFKDCEFIGVDFRYRSKTQPTDVAIENIKISNIQLELGTTATEYTPYVADLSAVGVSRYGKNLITPQELYKGCYMYEALEYENRNCIKMTSGSTYTISPSFLKPNTQYTVSFWTKSVNFDGAKGPNVVFSFNYSDGTQYLCYSQFDTNNKGNVEWYYTSFTSVEGKTVSSIGVAAAQYQIENYIDTDTFLFEVSDKATEYTPYIEPQTVTANADGTVEGLTSLYPNTTLMTDTEGVLIDCEYLTKNYKYVLDNRIPKQVQADWQQNDATANNYIKNRPGGYETLTEILPETTLNFTNSTSLTLTNCPPIEVGKEYIVTFYHPNSDNTEYELIGKNDSANLGAIYIGNETYAWGGVDTGEPFIIYNNVYDNSAPDIYIDPFMTLPCTYNIKIKAITPIKIDEKYLDIKNTNIVNGSKDGSLRTVGSAKESSEYTIGVYAFVEGYNTKASGYYSHAEGNGTTASGLSSHAEGYNTKASSVYSHAEGSYTTASGSNSHAEGSYTKASSDYQHVQGKYNIADTANIYADIIGNGSYNAKRSNAATVDWQGNAWYAGDVYVGSTSGKNKDEGSKKLATEEYIDNAINKKIEVSETAPTEEENKIWLQPMITNVGAVDYITDQSSNGMWINRTWNSGQIDKLIARKFFNTDDPDVLGYAQSLMANGFDGVVTIQLGDGAEAPTTYCMGQIICNGSDRCEVIIYGTNVIYTNLNQKESNGWVGWYKFSGTKVE